MFSPCVMRGRNASIEFEIRKRSSCAVSLLRKELMKPPRSSFLCSGHQSTGAGGAPRGAFPKQGLRGRERLCLSFSTTGFHHGDAFFVYVLSFLRSHFCLRYSGKFICGHIIKFPSLCLHYFSLWTPPGFFPPLQRETFVVYRGKVEFCSFSRHSYFFIHKNYDIHDKILSYILLRIFKLLTVQHDSVCYQ